jgi:pimeloyl-ACP methyl ester carboxylesterase
MEKQLNMEMFDMEDFLKTNYSVLDMPEILMYIFHPRPEIGSSNVSSAVSNVMIPVGEGVSIGGRFHMDKKEFPNILFFHGNGELASDYDDLGPLYNQIGSNFLPVDYRGYGRSTGTPSASAMMKDSHVILEYIRSWLSDRGFTGPLILMGRSLGSASVLELAASYPDKIKGLIIESGFAFTGPLLSLLGVNLKAINFDEKNGFGNLDKIKTYQEPTLIIHAERDQIIPFSDGQALFDASPAEKKTLLKIHRANHNDIFLHGFQEYMAAVDDLIHAIIY